MVADSSTSLRRSDHTDSDMAREPDPPAPGRWSSGRVRGKRPFDERLKRSSRSLEGQGIVNEMVRDVVAQVNPAQF